MPIFRDEGSAGNGDLRRNAALCHGNNMKNCTALAADLIAGAKRENNTGSISGRRKCNGVGGDARIRRVVFCNKSCILHREAPRLHQNTGRAAQLSILNRNLRVTIALNDIPLCTK